ncbi:MAG: aminotransferase class III-fold pyridoxal phosphate-dependent enzyme [Rikenellaceae bacterium]|nr:aminotransferase class III-fold pyridoxal phosphate-dependent enzyme [Rikenellaceae bacterium]
MKMFDVYPRYDVSIVKGEGSKVWDSDGNQYLDMYGGHAVISIGHTDPHYVETLTKQLSDIGFYSNSVRIDKQQELAQLLGKLSGKGDYRLFLVSSGAEANENALKLASFHTGRKKIVAFEGAFHGRTSLAVAATDNPAIVAPVNRTDNVTFLPFNDEQALAAYFAQYGDQTAAVIVEGIQGVAGIRVAGESFLRAIRRHCDSSGALYVADSVQCGCGRTGRYYSHDWAEADADIYTMAKGIGNGFPVGAIAIAPHIEPKYGMLGTTFGGTHLACAAAIAVAEVMLKDSLVDNAAAVGKYLMERLKEVPNVGELRGRGLMIGIEFPFDTAEMKKRLVYRERVFVGSSGKNTIRLLPALNIGRWEADRIVEVLKKLASDPTVTGM